MTKCEPRIDIPRPLEISLAICEDAESRAAVVRGHAEFSDDMFRSFVTIKPWVKRIRNGEPQ